LKNADEIRLGQLRMYIYFLDDNEERPATKKSPIGQEDRDIMPLNTSMKENCGYGF
jgi:hypothetical protein